MEYGMYTQKIQIKKENKIAAMDPVAKLFVVLFYFASSLIVASISEPFDGYAPLLYAWILIVFVLALASGILKRFFKASGVVFTIFILVLIVQALIVETPNNDPGVILWRWNISEKFHPTVWKYGLQNGLKLGFNIFNGASIFVWLFQSTENKELSRALEDRGMNYKVVYIFLSSMEMIGVLSKKSNTIMNAQRARGVETDGNLIVRFKAFIPSMIPLVVGSFTDMEERVLTMESKGFNAPCKKTHLLVLKKSGAEKPVVIVFAVLLAACIIGRILVWVL